MKKLGISIMICFLLGLTGCSLNENEKKVNSNLPTEEKKEISFDSIEKHLIDNGITIEEKVTMGAELIGAEEGIKFKTNMGNIEVYKFDISSDAYKKVVNDGKITLEGFGEFDAVYNENFVLVNPTDEIKAIFAKI